MLLEVAVGSVWHLLTDRCKVLTSKAVIMIEALTDQLSAFTVAKSGSECNATNFYTI